ncbi:MAG: ribosomal-processing cysteine protease Prp [Bacillota bacterium]|nr:ribosomal-processing cysteine protease Prp [Bacillota bacterium]
MIKALFKSNSGSLISFKIEGHAGYDDLGHDIVCSAVSSLTYAIANGITEVVGVPANCYVKDGYVNVELQGLSQNEIEQCQVLMKTMLLGLRSMEINYGDYISIEEREV